MTNPSNIPILEIELVNKNNYELVEPTRGGCFCLGPGYLYIDITSNTYIRACSSLHAITMLERLYEKV